MHKISRKCAAAAVAVVSVAALATNAEAGCKISGKWHIGALAGGGNNQAAIDCLIDVKSNGNYTGTCTGYSTGLTKSVGAVSGTLKTNAKCSVTGTIVSSFPTTTIAGGFVDGTHGYFVGYRGNENSPAQVRLGYLMKD